MKLEYLGEGEVEVAGVGVFGAKRFDRERKEWTKIAILPCPEEIAKQFEGDSRFKIHSAPVGVQSAEPRKKKKEE